MDLYIFGLYKLCFYRNQNFEHTQVDIQSKDLRNILVNMNMNRRRFFLCKLRLHRMVTDHRVLQLQQVYALAKNISRAFQF